MKYHPAAILLASSALFAGHASAAVYEVTGDIYNNSASKIGDFSIVIDEADLLHILTSGSVSTPFAQPPWLGYSITSAAVNIDGHTWDGDDVIEISPPIDGPDAEFWIENAPIALLDIEDFNIFFSDGPTFVELGFGTSTGGSNDTQILINSVRWDTPSSSGSSNEPSGGGVQNLNVELVPEPSSLALLGLGGLLMARRRR